MILTALQLGEATFTPDRFSSTDFQEAFRKSCSELLEGRNGEEVIVQEALSLLSKITTPRKITTQEQLTLACLEVKARVCVISEGEKSIPTTEELSRLSSTDMLDLIVGSISPEELEDRIRKIFEGIMTEKDDNYEIELLHTLTGTTIGIYEEFDNGNITLYVCDTKIGGTVRGFIVDENGMPLKEMIAGERYYIILNHKGGVEILHGGIDSDFERVEFIPGATVDRMNFYAEHTIGMILEGVVYLKNLRTGNIIFQEEVEEVGDIISVTDNYPQTTIIGSETPEGTYMYYVSDEDNVGDYLLSTPKEPTLLTYPGGTLSFVYNDNPLIAKYVFFDSREKTVVPSIECFLDLEGNISHSGEISYEIMTNGHIWLSYITLDENGEQQKQVYCTDKSTDTRLAQYVFPEDPTNIQ